VEWCSLLVFDEQTGQDPGFVTLKKRPIVRVIWKSATPLTLGKDLDYTPLLELFTKSCAALLGLLILNKSRTKMGRNRL
jgi:hypothetical protein